MPCEEIHGRVKALEGRADRTDERLDRHQTIIDRLQADMAEIKGALAKVATKEDVLVVLRDAVNAFPGRYTVILVGISVAIAVAGWLMRAH